jgi:hypothetical protein
MLTFQQPQWEYSLPGMNTTFDLELKIRERLSLSLSEPPYVVLSLISLTVCSGRVEMILAISYSGSLKDSGDQ